jgi:uncharacterized RmlC-like cupin family protein
MLRVTKVDDWLPRQPTRRDVRSNDDCVIIRSAGGTRSAAGSAANNGVSGASAGARALGLNLLMIPPGSRGMPHYHEGHETALYLVSGQAEVWYGGDLAKRAVVRAGDFIYVPPGTPHLAVNRGDVTAIAVVAKTDADDDGGAVVIELPRHLAGLLSLPVAVQ